MTPGSDLFLLSGHSHYNRRAAPQHRLHRSIGFVTPHQKWEEAQVVYDTTAAAAAFSENLSS